MTSLYLFAGKSGMVLPLLYNDFIVKTNSSLSKSFA